MKKILKEIWIYPVKAIGGVRVRSSFVREKGLENDRRWMLVDAENVFLTQREHPRLATFRAEIANSSFSVRKGNDVIDLPVQSAMQGTPVQARVWDDIVTVVEAGTRYHQWFSERVGFPCKLVSFPEMNTRPVDPDYARQNENVSLADAFPVLVIGEASLGDLNGRLAEPVPMNRFRPNFVVEGSDAYEEDNWAEFRVGNNRFVGVKNCSRCATTTVNQETGVKGREPLLTLSRYRRQGEKINFGRNVLAIDYNEVHEGDEIVVA